MPHVLNPEHKLPRPDDPAVVAAICEGYERGLSHKAIAGQLGIARVTLKQWLDFGRIELEADEPVEPGSLGHLYVQVQRAYASFESRKIDKLEAGKADWVAALAHVTRRNPQDWAERRYEHVQQHTTVTYIHELGPGAEQAMLARHQELRDTQRATETDTGGLPALPPAQQHR